MLQPSQPSPPSPSQSSTGRHRLRFLAGGRRRWLLGGAVALLLALPVTLRCFADGAASERDPALWPFASDSPWNQPIGSGVELEGRDSPCNRALADEKLLLDVNAGQWSHPVYVASPGDPLVTLYVEGKAKLKLRVPKGAEPAGPKTPDSDAHLHIVAPDHQSVDELWKARRRRDGSIVAESHNRVDLLGPGIGRGGARAYGGSALGGLIRKGELQSGIRHALALALPRRHQRRGHVWPASGEDDNAQADYTGQVPMGQLITLPRDLDLSTLGLGKATLAIARALKDYGAYDVDSASDLSFYAEPSVEPELVTVREELGKLKPYLRCVKNNQPERRGGGGSPLAPLAPGFSQKLHKK